MYTLETANKQNGVDERRMLSCIFVMNGMSFEGEAAEKTAQATIPRGGLYRALSLERIRCCRRGAAPLNQLTKSFASPMGLTPEFISKLTCLRILTAFQIQTLM